MRKSETFDRFVIDYQVSRDAPVEGAFRIYGVKGSSSRPAGWLMPPIKEEHHCTPADAGIV